MLIRIIDQTAGTLNIEQQYVNGKHYVRKDSIVIWMMLGIRSKSIEN